MLFKLTNNAENQLENQSMRQRVEKLYAKMCNFNVTQL